jgi:hypothetical protein
MVSPQEAKEARAKSSSLFLSRYFSLIISVTPSSLPAHAEFGIIVSIKPRCKYSNTSYVDVSIGGPEVGPTTRTGLGLVGSAFAILFIKHDQSDLIQVVLRRIRQVLYI